jgi:hypothetical protein
LLHEQLDESFAQRRDWAQVLLFRVFVAAPALKPSLRRTLDELVDIGDR